MSTVIAPPLCSTTLGPSRIVMSLRDPDQPDCYSTGRLSSTHATANMQDIARRAGYDHEQLVITHSWSHLGNVIFVPELGTIRDTRTGTLNPRTDECDTKGNQHSADALICRISDGYALGLQGADCPSVFLIDPKSDLMAGIHCGWRPLAFGIVGDTILHLQRQGAKPDRLLAFVGPGAGDDAYEFDIHGTSESLLQRLGQLRYFRYYLRPSTDNPSTTTLMLNTMVRDQLEAAGLLPWNIQIDWTSCIKDPRFHSYRRDAPHHGLSLSVMWVPDPA